MGGVHLPPLVQAILQGVGQNGPATLPVRVHSLPDLARTGGMGPDGIAIADPMVAQLAIVQEEKRKAKAYAVDAKAAKEKETTLYDRERDFSFLKICRYGQVSIKTPSKIETNTCDPIRASAPRNRHVNSVTFLGQKLSEPIIQLRRTLLRGGNNPTTEEAVEETTEAEETVTSAVETAKMVKNGENRGHRGRGGW